jgi:hypothetical protein
LSLQLPSIFPKSLGLRVSGDLAHNFAGGIFNDLVVGEVGHFVFSVLGFGVCLSHDIFIADTLPPSRKK